MKAAEVANGVNAWAEKKTNGIIKEVLPSGAVDNATRLVFANALYFKGAWNDKFDASATKDHDFHLLSGSSVKVPFMTSKKKQFVSQSNGFKVLSLPYKQGEDKRRFSMCIFLPDSKDGLPALVEKFGSESGFLSRHLPQQKVEVGDFKIPKFKISFGFEASNTLKGLGLVLPFFHKSFIEVNEEGTEAGAASVGVISLRSLRVPEKVDFVADHPFLFVIKEDLTGVVLFSGHIVDPSQAS
ncbi:PAZX [Linum perenne]